nr:MAG TPA: hypothetical protein [Caudoviricetes sp.]
MRLSRAQGLMPGKVKMETGVSPLVTELQRKPRRKMRLFAV